MDRLVMDAALQVKRFCPISLLMLWPMLGWRNFCRYDRWINAPFCSCKSTHFGRDTDVKASWCYYFSEVLKPLRASCALIFFLEIFFFSVSPSRTNKIMPFHNKPPPVFWSPDFVWQNLALLIDHHDEQEDGGQRRPDSLVVPISGQLDCVETEEVINVELGQ